jgi:hypothetical protein
MGFEYNGQPFIGGLRERIIGYCNSNRLIGVILVRDCRSLSGTDGDMHQQGLHLGDERSLLSLLQKK